jgi:KDO2-lipid IV(A) lauroyltransferase
LVPVVPARLARALAALAGTLGYAIAPNARANVRGNLRQVLGHPAPASLVRSVFREGAQQYLDLLRLPTLGSSALGASVEVRGWEHLERARAAGRGVLLVTAHLGSPNLVGQMIALRGCPTNVVLEAIEPPALRDLVASLRASHGIRPLVAGPGLLRSIVVALSRNELVGLFVDRDVLGNGVPVRFFGSLTRLPGGPAALGLRTGAAVLPAFTIRRPDGRYVGWFEPPLALVQTGDVRADVLANTARVTRCIEAVIRCYPAQWAMFQPVWPAPAPANSETLPPEVGSCS